MKRFKLIISAILVFALLSVEINSQVLDKKVSEMSKDEIMELTYDDLLTLSFEDLILVANRFGLSSEELLEFFLNKDVTSASKRSEKSINSPLSSTVISGDEIINSGATSIPEALRLVPGMIVREKTPGNFDVHIRGNDNVPPKNMLVYSENAISLVMIDGRPVYNYAFGGTFWETLPIGINDIERIEVIRGPSSALYGPNAVSGAINIITRKIESKKPHAEALVQMGNNNAKTADVAVSIGASDKLKFRFSGNYTKFDRFEEDFYMFKLNKKYSLKQLDTMKQYWDPQRFWMPVEADLNKKFPDPSLATDKYGVNAFVNYEANKNFGIDLSAGTQNSDVITTSLGNREFPQFGRTSSTNYADLRSHIYGFQAQVNYMYGDQFIEKENPGWHIDMNTLNASLEYEKKFGTLVLRPGISYQNSVYDDSKYINPVNHEGFMNGECPLTTFAYFLRADYKAFDKLRLIAAVRGDKYNKPDKNYFTYQFISTYDINANNVVRVVYSRANRGPFVVDNYANYDWVIIRSPLDGVTPYYTLYWRGNQNLNLPVMDMLEFGYRTKLTKNIMIDLEAFQTTLKDLNYFLPDTMKIYADFSLTSPIVKSEGHVQYYNMDLKSVQSGLTCNISVAINKQLNFKVFGTVSQTKLKGFYPKTIWNNFDNMTNDNKTRLMADGMLLYRYKTDPSSITDLTELQRIGQLSSQGLKEVYSASNSDIIDGKVNSDSLVDVDHKSTPSFYGGLVIDYAPVKKININTSLYFYSEQEFQHNLIDQIGKYSAENINNPDYNPLSYKSAYTVKAKTIVNLKISYNFWKQHSIFFNARNLFNSESNEFAYMDKVGGLYMVGLNLKF